MKKQNLFYGAAASTFIAGVLHIALVPMFFNKIPANVAIFFIVSGLAQLFWLIPVINRWSNIWYYVGIGGTAILIILWIIVVPHNEVSELEIAIELCQIVFIILCTIIIAKDRIISKFEQKSV